MDEAAWGALALTLTLLGGIYTWYAYQRRGLSAGLRGAGFTLLPVAAWLTDTLRLLTRIGDAVGDWAVRLVFSPTLWAGVILGGVAIVLFVVSGLMSKRGIGTKPKTSRRGAASPTAELAKSDRTPSGGLIDDEMAEIEALLRKRGIT